MIVPIYRIKIKKKIQETKDSVSFVFEVPPEYKQLFYYTPAQFLTFNFQIKTENLLRSYSLSSSPLLNEELKTTVKRVKDGTVSNYMIDHLKEGDVLLSRKPAGRFFRPPRDLKPKHYFIFAGGSGITPLFSIIKTVLLSDPENKVSLFYANRDEFSIIYHKELQDWATRYKNQFNIVHIFSQAKKNCGDIFGRLTTEHLEKYFLNISVNHPDHLYYLCGPLGLMKTVGDFLIQKQTKKTQIHKESFYSAKQKRQQKISQPSSYESITEKEKIDDFAKHNQETNQNTPSGSSTQSLFQANLNPQPEVQLKGKEGESEKAKPEIIKAFISEEEIEISAQADIPILEQLLSAGYSPPFSCLSGSCMSCLAVLKRGQIIQEERGILEDENLENYEILTCQAKPKSRLVEVDYDNL